MRRASILCSLLVSLRYIGTILERVWFLVYFVLSFIVDFNREQCF